MEASEIIKKQVEDLAYRSEYQAIIDLLTNKLLSSIDSELLHILYTQRGKAYYFLHFLEAAKLDLSQALHLNRSYPDSHYYMGRAFLESRKNNEAIKHFTQAITLWNDFSEAYIYRGIAFKNKRQYEKALEDFSKAIEVEKREEILKLALYNRADIYRIKKDYCAAIKDFDYALTIDNNFKEAIVARIRVLTANKHELEAITIYTNEISKNDRIPELYKNRGYLYYSRRKFEMAKLDFEKAISLDKERYDFLIPLKELSKIKLTKKRSISSDSLLQEVDQLIEKSRLSRQSIKLKDIILRIFKSMQRIKELSSYKEIPDVVHYTKLKIADIFICDLDSELKLFNVMYMNDPEEGEIFFNVMSKITDDLRTIYKGVQKTLGDDNNVYIFSCLPVMESSSTLRLQDDLILWRTYGKNETGVEAAGCSIVFDTTLFTEKKLLTDKRKPSQMKKWLYKVCYFNKRTKELEANDIDALNLKEELKNFESLLYQLIRLKRKNSLPNEVENSSIDFAINLFIYRIVSELRYFFKSSDYKFENECRVIIYASHENKNVRIEEDKLPRRLYYSTGINPIPYIKKIYLGPKVVNQSYWTYLEAKIKKSPLKHFNINVLPSECRYQ